MPDTRLRRVHALGPYAVAAGAVATSTVLRVLAQPVMDPIGPFTLFFPAVAAAGWYGGFGPGLLATILSSIATLALVLPLSGASAWAAPTAEGLLRLTLFVSVSVFISAICEAMHRARRPAAAKNIRPISDIAADRPSIAGEPARVQQIVWNLLSNAVKFTQPGGRVDISVSHSGSTVELCGRDDGAGIAQDVLPHVFERFRQADTGTQRRRRGLGLGLAIVRDIVELHGGRIRVESAGEGQGSTFIVEFPAIKEEMASSSTGSSG